MLDLQQIGNILNAIGGLLLISGYIPQAYTFYKTKNAGNNNIQCWVVMTFGIFCIGINQAIRGVPTIQIITQWTNIAFAIICTVFVIIYRDKSKDKVAKL